ncbi:MAG TPA: protein kinase [Fimbriiglobus sp.]|nr:protein kinase [Fimbriiglobus sp.]
MPAPATADEFLDLIQKSGVAEDSRLKAHLLRLSEKSGVPADPSKLAGVLVRDGLLTYFQADQLLQGKWKRFFIGKYKVLERIGVGGMGHVYLCEHKLMRRRVAVKVLPAAKAADPSSLERFYREARAVAALDHPNIVHAYDVDQDNNLHFLVMEYVDGINLHDLVKKFGPLDVTRACHYVYGAAVGLQHAFELGLVHRDIKPGNVLVDRSGVVKVLDMGLARFFNDDEDALTKKYDENILGTADYLAPEQAIDSHSVDIRADIYGLGGTFFYLLSGQPPFPEGTIAQKLLWHQTREPAELRSLRPEVPAELAAVVAKMMAKDAADRYQTPAEVMAALAGRVQSPIAPPDEKEMPQLSPAAVGTGTVANPPRGFSGPPTVVSGPTTVSVAGAPPEAGPSRAADGVAPRPAVPAPTPATGIPPAARAPVAPRRARLRAAPDPASADVWAALTAETSPTLKGDTDRNRRLPDGAAEPPRRRRRVVLFAVVGAVLALGLLVGGVAVYRQFVKPPPPPGQTADGPKTWYVSTRGGPDPDRTLPSLVAALDRAGPGDTVLILDDRIEDPAPVRVSRQAGVAKGVRVEAGTPAKKVVWAPRELAHDHGLIEIADIEDFTLSGLELDLDGRVDHGVVVSRSCPGLTLKGVTVLHPAATGFRFVAAVGEAGRPIRVSGCRVVAKARIGSAVELTNGTHDVVIEDSRLEGPGGAAVKVDGTAAGEVRNNRVYNFERGVYLAGDPTDPAAIDLTVGGNTFHTVTTGLDIQPLSAALRRLSLTRNYFAHTKEIASSPVGVVIGLQAAENARDGSSKEGNLPTNSAVVHFGLNTNTRNDALFLRPSVGKPGPVGPNNVPVGAR